MPDMSETQQNLRDPRDLQLTVLGLGEAGAVFASGIAEHAARSVASTRRMWASRRGDPVDTPAMAVSGADVVLAVTHAAGDDGGAVGRTTCARRVLRRFRHR